MNNKTIIRSYIDASVLTAAEMFYTAQALRSQIGILEGKINHWAHELTLFGNDKNAAIDSDAHHYLCHFQEMKETLERALGALNLQQTREE